MRPGKGEGEAARGYGYLYTRSAAPPIGERGQLGLVGHPAKKTPGTPARPAPGNRAPIARCTRDGGGPGVRRTRTSARFPRAGARDADARRAHCRKRVWTTRAGRNRISHRAKAGAPRAAKNGARLGARTPSMLPRRQTTRAPTYHDEEKALEPS